MKDVNNNNNNSLIIRTLILLGVIIFILAFNTSEFLKNIKFQDRVTPGDFIINSRIILVYIFAISGALIAFYLKLDYKLHASLMGLIFIIFGILPALSSIRCFYKIPSPLCTFIKPLIFISNGATNIPIKFIVTISSILLLSMIGSKIFCGWVCPIGALQDFIHSLFKTSKKIMFPFKITNSIRSIIFILSLLLAIVVGFNLYFEFLNPFITLRWRITFDLLTISSWIIFIIAIAFSIYMYRPYCYMICPIGLMTWLIEFITLARINYDEKKCTQCNACIEETNCPAVKSMINKSKVIPDCFSCGRCISVCPDDALSYKIK